MNIGYFIGKYKIIDNIDEYNIMKEKGTLAVFELNNWENGWRSKRYIVFTNYRLPSRYILNFIPKEEYTYINYIFDFFKLIGEEYYLFCQYYKKEYCTYLCKRNVTNIYLTSDISIKKFVFDKVLKHFSDRYIKNKNILYMQLLQIEKKVNALILLEQLKN